MSEPRLLGEIMCEYLLHSDDDYAKAFRQLYKEHGGDFLEEGDKKEENDK